VKCYDSKPHDGASFGAKVGLEASLGRCQTSVRGGISGIGTLADWLTGAAEPTGEMLPFGTFDTVCSLHGSIHECGGPSCDGLVLTAEGPAYLTQAYSKTNPQDLPALDGCLGNGIFGPRWARSNTGRWTDPILNITSGAQRIAARSANNKRRADRHDGATTGTVYLGLALLLSGHMDADSTHEKHSEIEFGKGWFEYVYPLTTCDMYAPPANTDVVYDCAGTPVVCGCYNFAGNTIGAYRGPPGWVEVGAAAVPLGTPLVKPYTYNLHFYEEIHEEEQGYAA